MRYRLLRASVSAAFACAALNLAPGVAAGQEEPEHLTTPYRWIERSLRVGPYGGYLFTDRGDAQLGPGSSTLLGGRFRVRLSSPLAFEIQGGYGSSDRYVVGDPRVEEAITVVDTVPVDYLLVQASLVLSLTGSRSWHRIQPYFLFGGGILQGLSEKHSTKVTEQFDYRIGTTPAIGVGAGAEWDVSDRIGVGFEARDHLWKVKTPDAFFLPSVLAKIAELKVPALSDSQWTHNFELSVTAWWYF